MYVQRLEWVTSNHFRKQSSRFLRISVESVMMVKCF